MANKLKKDTRKMILRLLCEGNSLRSASRLTGAHRMTVGRVIMDFGQACQNFMDEKIRGLNLRHVEVDEQWTFCGKKQARLTVEQKATCGTIGDIYLWIAEDQDTKLIASYALGKRSADMARRFMVDLASRLTFPKPHDSDNHAFQVGQYATVLQISSDGFAAYPEAVDLAFGPYVKYGQIIKQYKNATMQYDPSEIVGTERRSIKGNVNEWDICTSHVERFNGSTRLFCRRFNRLTYAFSKKFECLSAACAMYLCYYNWMWRTRYPDNSGRRGKLRPPAAMMAGVTDHLYKFDELYEEVINYEGTPAW